MKEEDFGDECEDNDLQDKETIITQETKHENASESEDDKDQENVGFVKHFANFLKRFID